MKTPRQKVCVLGSCNMDLVSYMDRLPEPGETLHGTGFSTFFGGKGANQAVMAAKTGAEVSLIGKVGADSFGKDLLKNFESLGIDVSGIGTAEKTPTGVASILVDGNGQNHIILNAGANHRITEEDVEKARERICRAKVFVCQLEVPAAAVLRGLRIARENGVFTLFNPAPAVEFPDEVYPLCDVICPNETEAAFLTGLPVHTEKEVETAARALLDRGCGRVLMTLGSRGVLSVSGTETVLVPAPEADPVDTTGAGDCFIGCLAALLAGGDTLQVSLEKACHAASLSVQKEGAQASFPEVGEFYRL